MDNWKDNIRRVEPYVPGEQPKGENIIMLNTNENPYTPALGVVNALKDLSDMNGDILRKYPDPDGYKRHVKSPVMQMNQNRHLICISSPQTLIQIH